MNRVTRLAPSPTGALHLGNARTFLVNWALARQQGWSILYRVEDLDGPRVKPEAAAGIETTLRWLGIDWDDVAPLQSTDLRPCRDAMVALAGRGLVYPSDLSRAEIDAAASAPHADAPRVFPRELRVPTPEAGFDDPATSWRFLVDDAPVTFEDHAAGPQTFFPARDAGDPVIWTKRGQPAYHLAVVVDDHRQGVTDIVRGDDLLPSTAIHARLRSALGLAPEPRYVHLPLVLGPDGRRLAKRHGDTRIDHYRALGITPERVVGLIAWWSGVSPRRVPLSAREFAAAFHLASMPREPVVHTPEDERWLRNE